MKAKFAFMSLCLWLVVLFGAATVTAQQGVILIDQVSNLVGPAQVKAGENIRFLLRFNNNTGRKVDISNGFKLWSPDGATWDSTTIDTAGQIISGESRFGLFFDIAFNLTEASCDGVATDTVGVLGAGNPTRVTKQLPNGYNDTSLAITAWFHNSASAGKTICIDTCFFQPGGTWKWVRIEGALEYTFFPVFQGLGGQQYNIGAGYCFQIQPGQPQGQGEVAIAQVSNRIGNFSVAAGQNVRILLRHNNTVGEKVDISNGFKVSSPDGAVWDSTTIDTVGYAGTGLSPFAAFFNIVFALVTGSPNGQGEDTVGFLAAGSPGITTRQMPAGYNDTSIAVTAWFHSKDAVGKHICIDTSFVQPGLRWIWVGKSLTEYFPSFIGLPGQPRSNGNLGSRLGSGYCFEIVEPPPQDSIIKLTQWRIADGGNDHWYAIFAKVISYENAKSEAPTFFHDGVPGYLATITSAAENSFIFDRLATGTSQPSYLDQFYLGGEYVGGLWTWSTGEPFVYTNWAPGEPNNIGIETGMAMFGPTNDTVLDPRRIPGKWNNVRYTDADGDIHRAWSIIEWGPASPPQQCRVINVPGDFATIQAAVGAAQVCDTVLVHPGSYYVPQLIIDKRIVLRSTNGPLQTTITTDPSTDMIIFRGSAANGAVLEGFTVDGGHIGIWCQNAAPIIRRNIIKNQTITNWAALVLSGLSYGSSGTSPAIIENNTIVHTANGGISTFSSVPPTFRNNIIAFNYQYGIHNQPYSQPVMGYNDIFGNPGYNIVNCWDLGPGALSVDPMLAADFSLNSGSPCINAGDPNPIYNDPDGSRNDMGAIPFGGGNEPPDVIPTNEWVLVYCAVPLLDRGFVPPGSIITAYDPTGVLCGATKTREDGSYGLMPIYRDDPYTQVDEGCQPGDMIGFKINGVPVYAQTPVYWTKNGDRFEVCQFLTQKCQEIHLHTGWNLISWNVALTTDIETLIAPFRDKVDLVLGFDRGALAYDPDLVLFSTLHEVDYFHGYWIKMNGDATLSICGGYINQFNNIIPIYQGWNLVGYWPDATWTVQSALMTVMANLQVAIGYEMGIKVYIPGQDMYNTLTHMKPGLGYWIRSSARDYLEYFFMPTAGASEHPTPVATGGNDMASRDWMSLYGKDITLDGQPLGENASIEVFTADGVKVGRSAYSGSLLKFMPVYGYDANDENAARYPKDGDLVTVFVNGVKTEPAVEWHGSGTTLQLSSLTTAVQLPGRYALSQNFPNPFNPQTTISFDLPKGSHVTLTVYNMLGQRIRTLTDREYDAGRQSVVWDSRSDNGDAVASGVYLYRIEADSYVANKKMILLK